MFTVSLASPAKTAAPSIQAHVIDPNQTSVKCRMAQLECGSGTGNVRNAALVALSFIEQLGKKLALLRFSWQMFFVEINLTAKRSQEMKLWRKVAFTGSWRNGLQQKTLWRWPCTGVSWKCTPTELLLPETWEGPSSQKSGGSSRYRHSPKEEKLQEGPSSQKSVSHPSSSSEEEWVTIGAWPFLEFSRCEPRCDFCGWVTWPGWTHENGWMF